MNPNISARSILKLLFVVAGFVGVLMLAFLARQELLWIGVAAFLAIAVNPAVERLMRIMPKHSRGLATTVVFLIGILAVGAMLGTLVPPLVRQTAQLIGNIPSYSSQLLSGSSWASQQVHQLKLEGLVQSSQAQLLQYAGAAGGPALAVLRGLFSSFAAGITILGLTFFMMLEGPAWLSTFWKLIPSGRRVHVQKLGEQMYDAVTGYVSGNVFTSLLTAIATALMLVIVDVPYAIPLGLLVGILDLLPLVGATIGAVIVVIVAVFTSAAAAIVMIVFFLIYQQVENHVLQPLVYGRTVQMSALLVLIAVLLGAGIAGIIGAIVAIPIAASIQILVRDLAPGRLSD